MEDKELLKNSRRIIERLSQRWTELRFALALGDALKNDDCNITAVVHSGDTTIYTYKREKDDSCELDSAFARLQEAYKKALITAVAELEEEARKELLKYSAVDICSAPVDKSSVLYRYEPKDEANTVVVGKGCDEPKADEKVEKTELKEEKPAPETEKPAPKAEKAVMKTEDTVEAERSKRGRPSKDVIDDQKLAYMYFDQGWSASRIASIIGIHVNTVYRRLQGLQESIKEQYRRESASSKHVQT